MQRGAAEEDEAMTTTVAISTASGAEIVATLEPVSRSMSADGWRVGISQDGHYVGTARWINGQIVDIDARLGAADGSETEAAYVALDEALADAIADDR